MDACVYTSANSLMVDHIRNLLAESGIDATVQRRYLSAALGEIPPAEAWPEVWVLDAERIDEARAIVDAALHGEAENLRTWVCDRCGESVGGQFTSCWKCDRAEDADEAPSAGDAADQEGRARRRTVSAKVGWYTRLIIALFAAVVLWMLRT